MYLSAPFLSFCCILSLVFSPFPFGIYQKSRQQWNFYRIPLSKVYFQVEKNLKTESTFKFYNKSISAVGGETYFFLVSLENPKGPFLNYASIQRYLVGQQNACFTKQTLFNRNAYLGYLLGQKQAKMCLRNLRTAPKPTKIPTKPYLSYLHATSLALSDKIMTG